MKTLKSVILVTVIIGITFTGCKSSAQTYNENEILHMKEEIDNYKSEINALKERLVNIEENVQTFTDEKNNKPKYILPGFGYVDYITINGNKVESKGKIIDEYGLNIGSICDVWSDISIEVQEYLKKTFEINNDYTVPAKFRISYKGKSVDFEGIDFTSDFSGDPEVKYFSEQHGEIKAIYKRGIRFDNKETIQELCSILGIGCTFYNNTLNFYTID